MLLTKHQGLGNDFLVLLDPWAEVEIGPELAVRLCDRRRGIGADGLLRATRPSTETANGAEAVMDLLNADGGRAEMSGNGIRCLAQALFRRGWATAPDIVIGTDAGLRRASLGAAVDDRTDMLTVDMGQARIGADAPEWTGGAFRRAVWVDMGNPHLVVEVDDLAALADGDLQTLGEKVNVEILAGANVHLVAVSPDDGTITLRPYERGVGLTAACGTGAGAAAAAAQRWGLVGDDTTAIVHMPGGSAEVHLGAEVRLKGPATFVAMVDTEPDAWR
jgi:diaminopimelate epimerase